MRLYCTVLLAVTSLLVNTDTAVKVSVTAFDNSVLADQLNFPAKRFLRVHKSTSQEEERGISTTGLESLVNSLKSKVSAEQLSALAKKSESTDDVFKLLTIDKKADDLLGSTQLDDWIAYMKIFNKENQKQQTSLVTTLLAHYGDDGVAKMVEAAKTVPKAATMAKRLQTEQIALWLEAAKTPDDIFKLLKLDKAGVKLFTKPEVNTWMTYVDIFNKVNPEKKTTMFSSLMHYDEKTLVDMLIAAKNLPSTEKIAVRVQADLTALWLTVAKTPDDIFTLLALNKAGDTLLQNPLFNAWIKYTDDFNLRHLEKESLMASTLTNHYSSPALAKMVIEAKKVASTEGIASKVENQLFLAWKTNGKSPSNVFKLIKLNQVDDKQFESPLVSFWLKYVAYFKEANPTQRVNLVSIMKKHFDDAVLAKMIMEAEKVPSTKTLASNLLDQLTIRWMNDKRDPATVYKWLRVEGTAADDAIRKTYDTYAKLYKMRMGV